MTTNRALQLAMILALAGATPACGSNGSSGATSQGGGGAGGASGSGGATSASGGATAGNGGTSSTGGTGSSAGGVDLSGTWIADVQTPGTETVPIAGTVNANIRVIVRLFVTEAAGTLNATFDICKLTAVTTPDPTTLSVTFTPAVIATLSASVSESAPVVNVGDSLPIPAVTIRSGITASGTPVDSDADSHPGVTIPGNVGGALPVNAYVGLTIQASLSPQLTAPDSISGTADFTASGIVFGSDNPLLTSGNISVTPQSPNVPFTAKLLPGDVPCADVVSQFP